VTLAIFDLDNTLLSGDSDYLWGVFLAEQGAVDGAHYETENERFYQEYKRGELDILEFLQFSLRPLSENSPAQLARWRQQFMQEKIEPIISSAARALVEQHRARGDTLMIITATNAFVTAPIAKALGVDHLLATEPEMLHGRYTGRVAGAPCFQDGKVSRLQDWLQAHEQTLSGSHFYSDSHNDLPLLQRVDHPVAVDPDDKLEAHAREHHWPILHLHARG
jgi:HAD superfamily hydrolase (TIGR01490 family)